jgi:hypothetical protein
MWFVLFSLHDMKFHKCKRVRNSLGLSWLRISLFRYLFGCCGMRLGAVFTERNYSGNVTGCQWHSRGLAVGLDWEGMEFTTEDTEGTESDGMAPRRFCGKTRWAGGASPAPTKTLIGGAEICSRRR